MRVTATKAGITAKAYAGTSGVLLAFDIDGELRGGLLGFAIRRSGGNRETQFLAGTSHFPGVPHVPGDPTTTDKAPVQRFRWSDYRVYPAAAYTYTVFAASGDPMKPTLLEGPTLDVVTESASEGKHRVVFNRAAAASQAFSREFPAVQAALDHHKAKKDPPFVLPPATLAWLSRGLLEQITGYLARAADATWALDIAIYEYELPAIIDAVNAAVDRGAHVRVVYHAKPGDPQTKLNETNLRTIAPANKRARVTSHICHDKFVVLSRLTGASDRAPMAVLCGSTNFTENGVYRQANVCHIAEDPALAGEYAATFQELFSGADPGETAAWIDEHNPLLPQVAEQACFSPRKHRKDLAFIAAEINHASTAGLERPRRDVLFCTAFALDHEVLDALLGQPHDDVLRLGLQNTSSEITGTHRDRTADFTATALFNKGLEGVLKESTAGQKGNILIHTKLIVLDFTSDAPTVISGSHNFSNNASRYNDENYLILRGDTAIADAYGVELLRLYDHYRARYNAKPKHGDEHPATPDTLIPNDSWADKYFVAGSLEQLDRQRFAGTHT